MNRKLGGAFLALLIFMGNRLANEKSPYLLQHASNPVDWYAWGDEAFEKARREDKPVFLSIGYSPCHWCHVMEEESFENPAVAKVMNETVVAIKVDREERPDIDNIYMTAVQALTGSGGWPLSVFLTPDRKPFFGGTYWPPDNRWGRPGFVSVLESVAGAWKNKRTELLRQSENLTELIQTHALERNKKTFPIEQKILHSAYHDLEAVFDEEHGGFGKGIKFPRSHTLSFLLRYWKKSGERSLEMVEKTLFGMVLGGMWDHVGGGFHRYSTDERWFLPHFEKMLYDQAILAKTYLEAYQATQKKFYAETVQHIFTYILRDLRYPGGGFYSAEDADSMDPKTVRKREGAFYVWEKSEILEVLGAEAGEIVSFILGVREEGNVANDPQGEFPRKNVLSVTHSFEETAKQFNQPAAEIEKIIRTSIPKLFEVRSRRKRPHLDDKILTDWNGLMISALAFGSRVLGETRYELAARQAADFILQKLVRKDGRLLHRYRDGESSILGTLEDYAFFIHGLIDLYEATFETRYLAEAKRLTGEMIRLFWDEEGKGFFLTGNDAEKLIIRPKEIYDGAIPSGNSVAALDLLRMSRLTAENKFELLAQELFVTYSSALNQNPEAFPQMLIALDFALGPSREIVIAGTKESKEVKEFLHLIYAKFLPNKVVALHPEEGKAAKEVEALIPFIEDQVMQAAKPTVYVCQNHVCKQPVTSPGELEKLLQ